MAPEAPAPVPAADAALVEGLDFYRDEHGRTVFTEHYNRRRGFCCFLGCRHCPWGQAGRTPSEAFMDLQRRLDALEERLAAAGLPVELRGYRDGMLGALPPAAACATDLPGATRLVLREAQGLLTVLSVVWG
jgi:Family of unknown function (DUF5522)